MSTGNRFNTQRSAERTDTVEFFLYIRFESINSDNDWHSKLPDISNMLGQIFETLFNRLNIRL